MLSVEKTYIINVEEPPATIELPFGVDFIGGDTLYINVENSTNYAIQIINSVTLEQVEVPPFYNGEASVSHFITDTYNIVVTQTDEVNFSSSNYIEVSFILKKNATIY